MRKEELLKERRELEVQKKKCDEVLSKAPEGKLRISHDKNQIKYYHRKNPDEKKGRFLKKEEKEIAVMLAEKDYYEKMKKQIEKKLNVVNYCIEKYPFENLGTVYSEINQYRKELIEPYVIPDEEYMKKWMSETYMGKPFLDTDAYYITKKNERVRSKSEIIIADKLYDMGIPYKYEHPLFLDGIGNIYPDFTILKINTREEIYLEHFGMMDKPEYVSNFIKKQSTYINNGIIPGKNLFMTFETSERPLNIRELVILIKNIID